MCEQKSRRHMEAIMCGASAEVQKRFYHYLRVAGKTRRHATSLEVHVQQQHRQLTHSNSVFVVNVSLLAV